MGISYACFADGKISDSDIAPPAGYYDNTGNVYVRDDGTEYSRWAHETIFCPEHDPGPGNGWVAIPNFDIDDYFQGVSLPEQ